MEIKVSKGELSRVLNVTGKMVPKKAVNPMFEYVLVNKDEQGVH